MKTRQIHGLGLGEFLIFAPAKEMLKSAYFFSALASAGGFFCTLGCPWRVSGGALRRICVGACAPDAVGG